MARLLGRDDRRVGAGGARRDRRCTPGRLRRRVRRRPRRARSRPLRLCRRPDRPRPIGGRRRATRQPGDADRPSAPESVPRRAHLGRSRAARPTPASARSSDDSTDWVDRGLERRSSAPWLLSLRLDEREHRAGPRATPRRSCSSSGSRRPTTRHSPSPTSVPARRRRRVFGFLRSADPRIAVHRQLGLIEPVLAAGGLAFDPVAPTTIELSDDDVRFVLRTAIPRLEELGVPVLLPRNWVSSASSRLRVNLTATSVAARSSGLLTTDSLARFDWKLAIGDTTLTEEELQRARGREGAADPDPGPLARAAPLRGRAGAAVPRSSARGLRRRPRPRRLGGRASRTRARARRGHARRRPRGTARRRRRAPLRAARHARRR